jgi:chromatin assembly factor 1 subunit A
MPSLETVEVPLLPDEVLLAAPDAVDDDDGDGEVPVVPAKSTSSGKSNTATTSTATKKTSPSLKRKITPASERPTAPAAANANANKRKKSNQMTLNNFFAKPSSTLVMTPLMTASTKKKSSGVSSTNVSASAKKAAAAAAADVGNNKTEAALVEAPSSTSTKNHVKDASSTGTKKKTKSQRKEPLPEQPTSTATTNPASAETTNTTTSTTTDHEKIRKAELLDIVLGRLSSRSRTRKVQEQAQVSEVPTSTSDGNPLCLNNNTDHKDHADTTCSKLNVKLLEKFDQDDAPRSTAAVDAEGQECESSSETTIATTAESTSLQLDADTTSENEHELEHELDVNANGPSTTAQTTTCAPQADDASKSEAPSASTGSQKGSDTSQSEIIEADSAVQEDTSTTAVADCQRVLPVREIHCEATDHSSKSPAVDTYVGDAEDEDVDVDAGDEYVEQSNMDLDEPSDAQETPKRTKKTKTLDTTCQVANAKDTTSTNATATKTVGGTNKTVVSKAASGLKEKETNTAKDRPNPSMIGFLKKSKTALSSKKKAEPNESKTVGVSASDTKETEPKECKTIGASTATAKETEPKESKTSSAVVYTGKRQTRNKKSFARKSVIRISDKSTVDLASETAPMETTTVDTTSGDDDVVQSHMDLDEPSDAQETPKRNETTENLDTTKEASKETTDTTVNTKTIPKANGLKETAKDLPASSIMGFLKPKTALSIKKKAEPKESKTTGVSASATKETEPQESKTIGGSTATTKETEPKESKTSSAAFSTGKRKARTKKSVASAAEKSTADLASAPAPMETTTLSDESKALLKKHETMRAKYRTRANELLGLLPEGLDEENFSIPIAEKAGIPLDAFMQGDDFPDFAVNTLSALIEGSRQPLSALAQVALGTLNTMYDTASFRLEITIAKIKLLATRVKYVKNPSVVTRESANQGALSTDLFEDDNENHMWRWEVVTLDFLPEESVANVKKARAAKRRASSRVNALVKLLVALNDADKLLLDPKASQAKIGKAVAKISQEEENVLKFERQDEKARLETEIKKKKEEGKLAEDKKKELEAKEKEQAAEETRKEKERKKEETAKARDESKRKKATELEEKQKKEQRLKEAKEAELKNQKACMNSFFGARKPVKQQHLKVEKVEAQLETKKEVVTPRPASISGFDAEAFRLEINSGVAISSLCSFASLSARARRSRKRSTSKVAVSVFVTVGHDNPFEAQPYAERQDVMVQNKYKFLRFREDCRPPYHGTWSKTSSIVKGNNPFGKDPAYLDYDYDSEAEWEEGDEEAGEDLENDMGDEEEEKDDEEGDLNEDGWLAADDEIEGELDGDEEETKMLRQKKLECGDESTQKRAELTVCVVAPVEGMPLTENRYNGIGSSRKHLVEGLDFQKGCQLLESHQATNLNDFDIWLDAFPPALIEEDAVPNPDQSASDGTKSSSGQDMSNDDMKTFVRFVHLCTLGSKDKVVDELRSTHESVTSSRAQAFRVLDSIAGKKKHPTNEVYWEVKKEVLEKFGLEDLVAKTEDAGLDANEATQETKKKVAIFVHHCTISSKEKVVDELRNTLESATASRAEAMRLLESVAEKKKDPVNGVYWEVKKEVRDELGLHNLPTTPPPPTKEAAKPATTPHFAPTQTATQNEKQKTEENHNSSGKKRKALSQENSEEKQHSSNKKAPPKPAGSAKILATFLTKEP